MILFFRKTSLKYVCASPSKSHIPLLLGVLFFLQKIKTGDLEGFRKWLNRKRGQVNWYRGGLATEGGLVVEGGTAFHWAAYYGQFAIVKALEEALQEALEDGGAGLIIFVTTCTSGDNIQAFQ